MEKHGDHRDPSLKQAWLDRFACPPQACASSRTKEHEAYRINFSEPVKQGVERLMIWYCEYFKQ